MPGRVGREGTGGRGRESALARTHKGARILRERQTAGPDTRPARRRTSSVSRAWDSPNIGEDIAEYGDGSVILCTDDYGTYNDIEDEEGVDD